MVAQSALDGIRIAYDAVPVRCDGAEVTTTTIDGDEIEDEGVTFDDAFHQPLISVTDDMRCAIRMQVLNEGWAEVPIVTAGLPGMGAETEGAIRAAFVNPNGQGRIADKDGAAEFSFEGAVLVSPGSIESLVAVIDGTGDYSKFGECTRMRYSAPYLVASFAGVTRVIASPPEHGVWLQRAC